LAEAQRRPQDEWEDQVDQRLVEDAGGRPIAENVQRGY
jgi:hypothetical protein